MKFNNILIYISKMSFSNQEKYYYYWSDLCYTAFPNTKFTIILDGREIDAVGYSQNYYLEEIKWADKKVVGISTELPWILNYQYKQSLKLSDLLTNINIKN